MQEPGGERRWRKLAEVDGQPMPLRGRIDRIDVNDASGKRMIFDYKTSDTADKARSGPPQEEAASGSTCNCRSTGTWSTALGIAGRVGLAYIVLPKDLSEVGHAAGRLDGGRFPRSADEAAARMLSAA